MLCLKELKFQALAVEMQVKGRAGGKHPRYLHEKDLQDGARTIVNK